MLATTHPDTAIVRALNREWTRAFDELQPTLLDSPFSLAEARTLFELAQADRTELADLRDRLKLDGGYLTRVVQRLSTGGWIRVEIPETDRRRRGLALTAKGRRAFATLDRSSTDQAAELLARFSPEGRRRFLAAAAALRDLLQPPPDTTSPLVLRAPRAGDLGWVVERHGAIYAQEYGWDQTFEALVARIVADYGTAHDPERESAWIAERDGERVGCIFCVRKDDQTAQLRILLVEPTARGLGLGKVLVEECLRFAERAGYRHMVLWTNDVLHSARKIYQAAGFTLKEEEHHESFGKQLVGQLWGIDLPRKI